MTEFERLSKELIKMSRDELFQLFVLASDKIKSLQAENETLKLEIRDLHNEIEDLNDEFKEVE